MVNRMITIISTILLTRSRRLLLLLATLGRRRLGVRRRVAGARHVRQAALAAVPTVEVSRHEGARATLRVRAHLPG
jgi:hypothetical protein